MSNFGREVMTMPDEKIDHAADAFRAIEAEIEQGRFRVYRNILGEPYFISKWAEGEGREGGQEFHDHLLHGDTAAWLSHYIWSKSKFLLTQGELAQVVRTLAGRSLQHRTAEITDPELLRLLESEPVAAAVVEFMQSSQMATIYMRANEMWQQLRTFAEERHLLVIGRNRFPGGDNVFCKKLKRLEKPLLAAGIQVTLRRSNGCWISFERLDDSGSGSSAPPSAANPAPTNDLQTSDDSSSVLRILQQRHSQQQPLTRNGEIT